MSVSYRFEEAARLPLPGDNVAVATRKLEAGSIIHYEGKDLTLDYTVLEGHRFAVKAIKPGEALLSWELPFGKAIQPIQPGNYVINQDVLKELQVRVMPYDLPPAPNFNDDVPPFVLDESTFQATEALPAYTEAPTFMGFHRSERRGVGTRNKVVLLGITSRTGSYVKQLSARLQEELAAYPQIDGIVPVAHTEGGEEDPNNLDLLLRTIAGFIVNPNVGAVLIVDDGLEPVTNKMVAAYLRQHHYPIDEVLHQFFTIEGSFQACLERGAAMVRQWLPGVNAIERTPESITHLKIGLQCGGSDAFSGISSNPLLGWIAQELVRYGGGANLAETDELIGAEPYILQKVKDLETARKFMALVDNFKTRTSHHGANAEGNPSGGNKYRGLYNIYLKSIGAAMKKNPETRLDHVIDYGAPMKSSGFHFMDSPGNDLESIAGQVASGCNVIFFSTGNGSITNFPFVPTVKVVTTTERYNLLNQDMDINAGQYQDGLPMDELGKQSFELMLKVASGQYSVGERAGHSQVQIWRNWRQTDASLLEALLHPEQPTGKAIKIPTDLDKALQPIRLTYTRHKDQLASDHIGLILPTSLCAGQVANMITKRLNKQRVGQPGQVSRFVTLPHTEGCGSSAGLTEELFARTMVSYVNHPMVKHCLLLEHGCEKTHNDFMRQQLQAKGIDINQLGYASIQLDGGIEKVIHKVEAWFVNQLSEAGASLKQIAGLEALRIGLMCDGPFEAAEGEQLAQITKMIVGAGGTVVVPQNSEWLSAAAYRQRLFSDEQVKPSLAYGAQAEEAGFHIMETPTKHWVETVTGLAATGVELIIALVNRRPMQTHPFVPILQVASKPVMQEKYANDVDLILSGDPALWTDHLLERCKQTIEHSYTPRLYQQGNVDFQLTRGYLGVSL
jgi:altronate dehydratase